MKTRSKDLKTVFAEYSVLIALAEAALAASQGVIDHLKASLAASRAEATATLPAEPPAAGT